MDVFKWTEALETKNSKIDEDHKMIISKAHELHEAMAHGQAKEHVAKTLNFLNSYVRKHFAEEEQLQMSKNYPGVEVHKKNHAYFIEELDKLSHKIGEDPNSLVNAIALNQLISGWFFNHIKKMDVEVAKYLHSKE